MPSSPGAVCDHDAVCGAARHIDILPVAGSVAAEGLVYLQYGRCGERLPFRRGNFSIEGIERMAFSRIYPRTKSVVSAANPDPSMTNISSGEV